ncbi:MAG: hypothetical protein KBH11_05555 [Bacteroidia bacterium]|nr:hypothetical protein [Bacteroidia bacterium]
MIRNILSVITGLAAAIITFLIAESINGAIHPIPPTLDFQDSVAVKTFYNNQPFSMWLLVLTGWIAGSFLCGLLIRLISRSSEKRLPLIAGIVLTLSAVTNFYLLPHPTWFIVVGLLVFVPSALAGHQLILNKSYGK